MAQQVEITRLGPLEASSLLSLLDRFDRSSPWEAANNPEDSCMQHFLPFFPQNWVVLIIKSNQQLEKRLYGTWTRLQYWNMNFLSRATKDSGSFYTNLGLPCASNLEVF